MPQDVATGGITMIRAIGSVGRGDGQGKLAPQWGELVDETHALEVFFGEERDGSPA
jgi:hypothetical protein